MKIETTENGTIYPTFNSNLPESLIKEANQIVDIIVKYSASEMKSRTMLAQELGLTFGEANRILSANPDDFETVLVDIFGE